MYRNIPLVTGEYYHVFNKSIEHFRIFNNKKDFHRMLYLIQYYRLKEVQNSFSDFIRLSQESNQDIAVKIKLLVDQHKEREVKILAYCLMPTHIHFILKQLADGGITTFMRLLQNSYARYFNLKYRRRGPLWTGRFQARLIDTDELLMHMSRYVHLNPVTACLVAKSEEWGFSSYQEYLGGIERTDRICQWEDELNITPEDYRKFVEDRASYQRDLAKIKKQLLEE